MSVAMVPSMPVDVATVLERYPEEVRDRLIAVRSLIFRVADATNCVGPLTETLKWGEPAYLTEASGSGSTIRLGVIRSNPVRGALHFNCRTTLIESFRRLFSAELVFGGNRSIVLDLARPLPEQPLAICIGMALTYHRSTLA